MASEDLLKKAVAAFKALSPEQQAEMLEEQRQSWVRGNVGLSRDERGMTSPMMRALQTVREVNDAGRQAVQAWADSNTRPAPAATDTGLETVGYLTGSSFAPLKERGSTILFRDSPNEWPEKYKGSHALVTRSQADELLAAERAEKEEARRAEEEAKDCFWSIYETYLEKGGLPVSTEGARSTLSNRIASLEADNAALTARVKELEGINANLMGDDEDKPRYTTKRLKHEIARATEALEAKLASKDGWKELHDAAQVAVKERTEACNSLYKQVATLEAKLAAAQEALEPFALISSEGVIKQETGHVTVITCAEYFHKARAVLGGKPS